jgi:hypothetical protein
MNVMRTKPNFNRRALATQAMQAAIGRRPAAYVLFRLLYGVSRGPVHRRARSHTSSIF